MDQIVALKLAALGGYLLGSIPFGLVLTRMAGLGDIREIGSGNIGATNVLRTGNKPLALATLLLDSGKGAIAAAIALYLAGDLAALMAGGFAVLGHNFPVWLRFKGGKGVATTLGVFLVCQPIIGLFAALTWLAAGWALRYSSLGALAMFASAPLYALFWQDHQAAVAFALLGALGYWQHRANIARLLAGTEPRIGAKAS